MFYRHSLGLIAHLYRADVNVSAQCQGGKAWSSPGSSGFSLNPLQVNSGDGFLEDLLSFLFNTHLRIFFPLISRESEREGGGGDREISR